MIIIKNNKYIMKLSDLLKVEGRSSSMHSFNRSSYYSTINSSLLNGWD